MAWTYLLRCADDTYYVGSTIDLDARLWQHNHSDDLGAAYTRRRRPVTLAWCCWFDRIEDAYRFESRSRAGTAANAKLSSTARGSSSPACPDGTPSNNAPPPRTRPPAERRRFRGSAPGRLAPQPPATACGMPGARCRRFRGSAPGRLAPQPPATAATTDRRPPTTPSPRSRPATRARAPRRAPTRLQKVSEPRA
ncbi:MAG TPA: GIY-YIG nuclease family protein [Nocardioides sp.]|nr:GIY-YIG nuclease family protein [Nocardioides sp.]